MLDKNKSDLIIIYAFDKNFSDMYAYDIEEDNIFRLNEQERIMVKENTKDFFINMVTPVKGETRIETVRVFVNNLKLWYESSKNLYDKLYKK